MAKLIDREWVSQAPKLSHVAPFDGIRGLGVIFVMVGHALPLGTLSFTVWVDVFFVISGFLITTLLLQEHRNTGGVDVKKFYARRILRLLPALYVMLVGTGLIVLLIKVTDGYRADPVNQTVTAYAKEAGSAVLYIYNVVFPFRDGPWVDHLWTLSVEEQFYIAIGLVAFFLIARGGFRITVVGLIGLVVAIQLSRLVLYPSSPVAAAVWVQRPDSLMVGMLGAFVSASLPDPISEQTQRRLRIGGWVSLVVFLIAMWTSTGVAARLGLDHPYTPKDYGDMLRSGQRPNGFYWIQWGHSVASWSVFFITLCAFRVADWAPNRWLSNKRLVIIGGTLSYSLYIWHAPVQTLVHAYFPDMNRVLLVIVGCTLPFVVAIPSYRYVEVRALRLKNRFAVEESPPKPGEAPPNVATAGSQQ